jgi:polyisoprenoid-binding protein YceI
LVAACVVASSAALAGWKEQGTAEASFKATGPAGLKILGKTTEVDLADDGKDLSVTVKVDSIDTDNSLRNGHMKEDIEAEKFPTLGLKVPLSALQVPEDGKSVEAQATGTLTLHGQSKELPFRYKASCKGGTCEVEGSADIKLSDFGIKPRKYLGIGVRDEVTIATSFKVSK